MDYAYIINLARAPEKRATMVQQMDKTNLKYEIFNAIDGRDSMAVNKFSWAAEKWVDPNSGRSLTKGEVGCSLSHYSVWMDIIRRVDVGEYSESSKFLILEDDVIIDPNIVNTYNSKLAGYTDEFDLLYLNRKALDIDNELSVYPGIYQAKRSYWACAYVITGKSARIMADQKYLDHLIPVDEYIPALHGEGLFGYSELFKPINDFRCLALNPTIIKLNSDAFINSSTFHSESSSQDSRLLAIWISSDKTSYAYRRFCQHNSSCGLVFMVVENIAEVHHIIKETNSELILLMTGHNILPIGSAEEIINTYFQVAINSEIVHDSNMYLGLRLTWLETWLVYFSQVQDWIDSTINQKPVILDEAGLFFLNLDNHQTITVKSTNQRVIYQPNSNQPSLIHGSTNKAKLDINKIENYTGPGWSEYYGFNKTVLMTDYHPMVMIVVLGDNIDFLESLDYPSEKYAAFKVPYEHENQDTYKQYITNIRQNFIDFDYEYLFFVDPQAVLTNPRVLHDLLSLGKPVAAPMLKKKGKLWSNFWAGITEDGWYMKANDYETILNCVRRGWWNVPYVTHCYLADRTTMMIPNLYEGEHDADMNFAKNLREHNIPMFVCNMDNYGEQVDMPIKLTINSIMSSEKVWEQAYLHPDYSLEKYDELCPDIYSYPLFSQRFCSEIISRAEQYGNWSAGKDNHIDNRIAKGYYENYPTVDIQLFELDLAEPFSKMVMKYVAPFASKLYSNFSTKKVHRSFIVKYTAEGQDRLKPHHDSSIYTINIALNTEYEGGGCRFIRQNYILRGQPVGQCSMHPGRLTAYHEGLPVSLGIRYILVAFIE